MKKLFSMAAVFLIVFTLSACTEDTGEQSETNQLNFTIEIGEEGYTHSLSEDYEGTLFDVVDDAYILNYSSSEYGVYMISLENLTPKNGQYIMVSENGEMAATGIDQLVIEDGDTFTFELVWYDPVLEQIDEIITLFLENQIDQYVTDSFIDVNVLSALRILDMEDQYVENIAVEDMDMVDSSLLTTTAEYFKAIVIMNSLGYDISTLLTDYIAQANVGFYGETAYGLLLLQMADETNVESLINTFEQDLTVNTPFSLGLDAGGISLVALSNSTFDQKQALLDQFTTWIQESQLDTGGVKTSDMVWGDTTYPGTENAASISQVIIGLLANGIDPAGADYTVTNNNLINRLLDFSTADGAFDYLLDDELTEDLAFSTPQAFLAIVMYQEYKARLEAVHPYHVD